MIKIFRSWFLLPLVLVIILSALSFCFVEIYRISRDSSALLSEIQSYYDTSSTKAEELSLKLAGDNIRCMACDRRHGVAVLYYILDEIERSLSSQLSRNRRHQALLQHRPWVLISNMHQLLETIHDRFRFFHGNRKDLTEFRESFVSVKNQLDEALARASAEVQDRAAAANHGLQ